MKLYEEYLWAKADYNIAPSLIDAKQIKKTTGKDCPVIANGVAVDDYSTLVHQKQQQG